MDTLRVVTVLSAILSVYSVVESRKPTCYVCTNGATDNRGPCGISVKAGVTHSETCTEDGSECFVLATWKAGVLTQVMRDCSKPCVSYSDTDSSGTVGNMACCDNDKCNANFTANMLSTTLPATPATGSTISTIKPTSGATTMASKFLEILLLYLLCTSSRKLLS